MKTVLSALQAQFDKMCATGKLFKSTVSGHKVFELYMQGFGEDPIFRDPESSEHNCNLCKNFLYRYGNIVAIDENLNIMTLFDIDGGEEYNDSFILMSDVLKMNPIEGTFTETFNMLNYSLNYEHVTSTQPMYKLGIPSNVKRYTKEEAEKFGVVKPNEIRTFHHFSISIPKQFIDFTGKTTEAINALHKVDYELFSKAMEELPIDTLMLVRDLINQGSLLDGATHLHKVEAILKKAQEYQSIPTDKRALWCWSNSYNFKYARFKNELIGTLCTELAEGKELNEACKAWNIRVDPINYMKATAPITKKQIEEAQKFVEENGYAESFERRCATIEDIKASDILHINSGDGTIKKVSIFDGVKATSTRHKRSEFDKVETVSIEKFMKDILPTCTSVEAFLLNSHKGNMVTLTTSINKDSKPIFKWPNNYSWTYNGNLAGKSQIKEEVKKAGGFVDAFFRFSIMWNEDGRDIVDLDAHAMEPTGHIYYGNYKGYATVGGGMLDIDMIDPSSTGIENIFWTDPKKLRDGNYRFFINNFNCKRNKGAKAEIAFGDEVFTYEIKHEIQGDVDIATVQIKDGQLANIQQSQYLTDSNYSSMELYGLDTNEFHKVNLVCLSPNHWDAPVGNKHYFFMLEGCKAPTQIRSFHNENLIPELLNHRKVMEVLANTTMIESTDKQLSGLGFNATVHDELILKLKGSHNRIIKVQF